MRKLNADKLFAAQYPRTPEGWIQFPWTDKPIREHAFSNSIKHPSPQSIYLIEELVNYVSEPGQTIMDIMAGSGTILWAITLGRKVIAIELEPEFHQLQKETLVRLSEISTPSSLVLEMGTLINADCRDLLPLPCDHIIFSPPYADSMKHTSKGIRAYQDIDNKYVLSDKNLGNMPAFFFNQTMESIYQKCFQSIRPGGTLTVIIKDQMEQGKRIYHGNWAVGVCIKAGFVIKDWFKRYAPTGMAQINKAKGAGAVWDEDIIILRKPA